MTDQEICKTAIGGAWPREALPATINTPMGLSECLRMLGPSHAPALFRDSGLGWLQANDCDLSINDCTSKGGAVRMRVYTKIGVERMPKIGADTLLAAIDFAIQSLTH